MPGAVRSKITGRLAAFFAIEGMSLAGFLWLFGRGNETAAFAFLIVPLQVLVFLLLVSDEYWMLCYFVAILPFTALELLPHRYVHLTVYLGVLILWLWLRATRRIWSDASNSTQRPAVPDRAALMVLSVMMILSGLSAYLRGWFSSALVRDTVIGIEVLLVVSLFATVPRTLRQVKVLFYIMAVAYAVVCLALPFFATRPGGGLVGKTIVSPGGLVNMNAFAAHIGAFLMILMGVFIEERKGVRRFPLFLAIAVLLAAFLFTRSRGAWLGFGFAFLYVLIRARSWGLLLLAGTAMLGLISTEVMMSMVASRVEATGVQDPSLLGRLLFWKSALGMLKDNWLLGVGFQNFRFVKHVYGFPWPKAFALPFNTHNLFLEMLVDLGVVGFVSFTWLVVRAALRVDRIARLSVARGRGLAIGLCAAVIMYAVHGMFDCIIWHHGAFILLGVILGLGASVARLATEEVEKPSTAERAATWRFEPGRNARNR